MPFIRSLPPESIAILKAHSFWQNICLDPELLPEIRVDAVTVYYRGGALLRELRVVDGTLLAEIHHKFVPLRRSGTTTSLRLVATDMTGFRFGEPVEPLPLGTADPLVLRAYKALMDQVLAEFPEGQIVQAICTRSENQILDQEVTFQEPGESRDKIDVCHFDYALGKLAFVEVKRKDDARLFQHETRPEVLDQLEAYCKRLQAYRSDLLAIYRQVVAWKRDLGLSGRLSQVPSNGPSDLLDKPVLVIGNCTSSDVRRIKAAEGEWAPLLAGLKEVASGLILCGRDGCRLNLTKGTQTISYL